MPRPATWRMNLVALSQKYNVRLLNIKLIRGAHLTIDVFRGISGYDTHYKTSNAQADYARCT